ncbi:hypothetical protein R4P64_29215 [Rhodococcus sp. IEGM 1366]|nr:hypothetical protein [Rhodococcus sp. IEGM 1366]MDV8070620.1 hypothetical protein [Rhodococcus sp. IEGM 1366]
MTKPLTDLRRHRATLFESVWWPLSTAANVTVASTVAARAR